MFNLTLNPQERIKELFPPSEFQKLGLPNYAIPKMHSSFPQKPRFENFEKLAKCLLKSARLFSYSNLPLPLNSSIILFTWVMPDGLGDWSLQHAIAHILKKSMPNLKIELITLVDSNEKRFLSHPDLPTQILTYNGSTPVKFPPSLLKKVASTPLILQAPTYYPHFDDLFEEICAVCFQKPPTVAHIGEYGFIDSEWFHPESGNICMGLHSLEKGILLHTDITSVDVTPSSPFYFAYLVTTRGYAIYLHTLLKYKIAQRSDIKIIITNLLPLLEALKSEDFSTYGIKEIVVRDDQHETTIEISNSGKKIVIECRSSLSSKEVQKLYLLSENFVGCRGDRSFSETVSLDKCFFYDAPTHSLPFLKDLYDVAAYYLLPYPALHDYLKTLLDQKSSPKILGHQIADLLPNPSFLIGMQKLLALLRSDFLFNPTLINLVKAKLYEHFNPELKKSEETLFKEFLNGAHSLESLLWKKNLTVS